MNAAVAYSRLLSLGPPVVSTSEAAAVLGSSALAASQTLRRLAAAGLLKPLRHGLFWVKQEPIDPWVALEWLAAPYPAYASLYSALYLHGALSQLPQVHYAVTVGRPRKIRTSAGALSLHRVAPELFGGFTTLASGAKLATIEKALFDLAYLGPTRSRVFARPPELEFPPSLDRRELARWVKRVADPRRRAVVQARLDSWLRRSRTTRNRPTPGGGRRTRPPGTPAGLRRGPSRSRSCPYRKPQTRHGDQRERR